MDDKRLGASVCEVSEGAARQFKNGRVACGGHGVISNALGHPDLLTSVLKAQTRGSVGRPILRKRDARLRCGMVAKSASSLDPAVRIGHVHLKVADLEHSLAFYCGVLGFTLMQRFGSGAAFISAGGYHHHIGLNTWESAGGLPPAPGTTGLYHVAILYPGRTALADALQRLQNAGIDLDGAADHGVSEALYLHDPDNNGVELYRDRPQDEWPRTANGELAMFSHPLDLAALLAEVKAS
jgi:catechol 2,3-dioxygenase